MNATDSLSFLYINILYHYGQKIQRSSRCMRMNKYQHRFEAFLGLTLFAHVSVVADAGMVVILLINLQSSWRLWVVVIGVKFLILILFYTHKLHKKCYYMTQYTPLHNHDGAHFTLRIIKARINIPTGSFTVNLACKEMLHYYMGYLLLVYYNM